MNLLMLVHRIPYPPNKGEKLRAYHELRHLADRHDTWLACFVDDPADLPHAATLRQWCRDVLAVPLNKKAALAAGALRWFFGGTITEGYFGAAAMGRGLGTWSRQRRFDCVLAYSSSMARYALAIDAPRRVLDFVDLDSAKFRAYAQQRGFPGSLVYGVEASRMAARERAWAKRFDASIFITPAEAADLDAGEASAKVHVIGNGVEVDAANVAPLPASARVGFVGMMDYFPNVEAVGWFVEHVWPIVRERRRDATFVIVGRSPTSRVRALASSPGVIVTGAVDDVQEYLRTFRVSVAPFLTARGLQNKVLEAMAAGRPVVVTERIARSLRGRAGEHFLAADKPAEFADCVVRLIEDDAEANRLAANALGMLREHYRWETELRKLAALVDGGATA